MHDLNNIDTFSIILETVQWSEVRLHLCYVVNRYTCVPLVKSIKCPLRVTRMSSKRTGIQPCRINSIVLLVSIIQVIFINGLNVLEANSLFSVDRSWRKCFKEEVLIFLLANESRIQNELWNKRKHILNILNIGKYT